MRIFLSLFFGMALFTGWGQFANFPVMLSLPYDADTITTTQPTFVWQCNLSAIQNDPRLSLQFALVEKEGTQTAAEAIATNQAICTVNGLLATSYSYPSTLQELQKGHTYVWQVQLLFNDQVVQESEPWKFTIADPKPPIHQYIALSREKDGSFHVFKQKEAWLILKEDYDFNSQHARVRKPDSKTVPVTLEKVLAGDHQDDAGLFNESRCYYLHCNLESIPKQHGIYTLEVTSKSGKVYSLNFTLE